MKPMKKSLLFVTAIVCFLFVFALGAAAAVHGDVDGSGEVDVTDARYALRASVGLENYAPDSMEFLTADVDGNNEIEVTDARTILRAAVGLENLDAFHSWGDTVYENDVTEASCTQALHSETVCRICGEKTVVDAPALAHDFSDVGTDPTSELRCARCDYKLPSFNALVNELKQNTHFYSGFVYSSSNGKIKPNPQIKISLAAKLAARAAGEKLDENTILDQLTQEMTQTADGYNSYVGSPRLITDRNFDVIGSGNVSNLIAGDVTEMTVEETEGVDFIASLPDTLNFVSAYGNATFSEDITNSIKAAQIGAVKKVTVKLKDEKYSQLKDSTEETALQRIMGYDIRALADELNQKEDADGMLFEMKCNEAVGSGSVVYYFDSETLMPIAAVYDMSVDCDQSIVMDAKSGGISMMSGNIGITLLNKNTTYYFFDGYFEPKA